MTTRRTVLRAGGGMALLALGAGVARGVDQGLLWDWGSPGLAAWQDWNAGRYRGPLLLVSAGVLAASPHNTQPWGFAVGRRGVDIFEVPARALGAMDPFGRERLAGLGGAILNMALASTMIGRAAVVRLLPDPGNAGHVARIELGAETAALAPNPLVAAIGRRHTDRGAWRGGPVPAALRDQLRATAGHPDVRIVLWEPGSPEGRRFAALTAEATAAIVGDAEMMAASRRWSRHLRRDQDRLKDGIQVATSGVSPWLAAAAAMLPEQSPASEGGFWLAATRDTVLPTASLFGAVLVRDPHDRRQALLAGMAWQRLHLTATRLGLAAQPLNQLPEMIDRERQLGRRRGFAGQLVPLPDDPQWQPTFTFRIGHSARPAAASPRRPVSEVIGAPARLAFDVDMSRAETLAGERQLRMRAGSS